MLTAVDTQIDAEMCRIDRWSVRELKANVSSMLFERTALAKHSPNKIKAELKSLRESNILKPGYMKQLKKHEKNSANKLKIYLL